MGAETREESGAKRVRPLGCYFLLEMADPFDPKNLPPSVFEERIAELEQEVTAARRRLESAEAELAWWQQGFQLFAADKAPQERASIPPEETPRLRQARVEMARQTALDGGRPTLRQAILTAMRESDRTEWPVLDLMAALRERDRMPKGKNDQDIVRGMVSTMTKQNQLVRVGYGVYSLADRMPASVNELLTPDGGRTEP